MGRSSDRHSRGQGKLPSHASVTNLNSSLQAGGKEDSSQGVGAAPERITEAVEAASQYLAGYR